MLEVCVLPVNPVSYIDTRPESDLFNKAAVASTSAYSLSIIIIFSLIMLM